jgi:hypothetical protein
MVQLSGEQHGVDRRREDLEGPLISSPPPGHTKPAIAGTGWIIASETGNDLAKRLREHVDHHFYRMTAYHSPASD